jgi:hypothetical protein
MFTILSPDEKPIILKHVNFFEERSVRRSTGSGMSFRLMRGVYYHTGAGVSFSTPQMMQVDTGHLIVTNKRLIFIGQMRSFEIPITRIINVAHGSNAIMVSASGNYKNKLFVLLPPNYYTQTMLFNDINLNFRDDEQALLMDALITGAVKYTKGDIG